MSPLECFTLYFEPDEQVPQFLRLRWRKEPVGIADVMQKGIHPWLGTNIHSSLVMALLERLNRDEWKLSELKPHGYCSNIQPGYSMSYGSHQVSHFERILELIGKEVYFTEELTYLEVLSMAKTRLKEQWSHRLARSMAESLYYGFHDLRSFLKQKDPTLRFSGYRDLDNYDLGQVLSLEDFEGHDGLIISSAFERPRFRRTAFLKSLTDGEGRLRMVPEISRLTVRSATVVPESVSMEWHVSRKGEVLCFRPNIGKSARKRNSAKTFAETWRMDSGRICFSTRMEQLEEMVEQRVVVPLFPMLDYLGNSAEPAALAELAVNPDESFRVGGVPNGKWNGDRLREILFEYGRSRSGNKATLLKRIAALAMKEYRIIKPELDDYFSKQKYVRVAKSGCPSKPLPLSDTNGWIGNLVLSMYLLMHLRGNTILDSLHETHVYTEGDLALALVNEDVTLSGVFLRAA